MTLRRIAAIGFLSLWVVAVGLPAGLCKDGRATEIAPGIKEGIIAIECHPQKFTMRRVDGDPYPYYTYVPHDVETERFSGPEGTGIRFWMNRGGGDKRYQAFAEFFVFPQGTTREHTRQIIDGLMSRSGWDKHEREYKEEKSFPWSLYEMPFTAAWYSMGSKRLPIGTIAVGQHGDLFFGVLCYYRASYSDGFVPRYLRILDELVWADTNEGLPRVEMQRCSGN
ncbi:hypothetical protein [Anaeroselena agilis]|uniref:Uncharacterized protein n=1 Tax=Anaeroselena agilis TaxID=3063788 RepID=A0ABU3NVJ0_9FIRM|nr:hypothetical protein [Selenomonadales bacterium 4137-cl]